MAGLHGSFNGDGMTALMMAPTEEFQEEDVWGLMYSKNSSSFKIRKSKSGPTFTAWSSAATPTAIQRSASASSAAGFVLKDLRQYREASSPVEIPDWSKILEEEPKKTTWWDDEDVFWRKSHHVNDDDDDVGIDDDDDMLPPHEFLAMRIRKRSQVAYSMCEGIGRTLKGRDLSNLRNAILAKTGFLE